MTVWPRRSLRKCKRIRRDNNSPPYEGDICISHIYGYAIVLPSLRRRGYRGGCGTLFLEFTGFSLPRKTPPHLCPPLCKGRIIYNLMLCKYLLVGAPHEGRGENQHRALPGRSRILPSVRGAKSPQPLFKKRGILDLRYAKVSRPRRLS
jgi:hypothetical protein